MDTDTGPNLSALAADMLKWERLRRELDELEWAIKDTVLQLGKTQTVGNVRATFSKGRKSYYYQAAAEGHPMVSDTTLSLFTKPIIDWRGVCNHVGIDDIPFSEGEPSVSLKILS